MPSHTWCNSTETHVGMTVSANMFSVLFGQADTRPSCVMHAVLIHTQTK